MPDLTFQVKETEVAIQIKVFIPQWCDPKKVVEKIEAATEAAFKEATTSRGL